MASYRAVDAVNPAIDHTRRMLFKPFDLGRWLKLAFVALLGGAAAGGGFNFNGNLFQRWGGGPGGGGTSFHDLWEKFTELISQPQTLVVLVVLVLFLLAVGLAVWWIRAVFSFVWIETVAHGDVEIGASFQQHRHRGLPLMGWYIGITVASFLVLAIIAAPIILAVMGGWFNPGGPPSVGRIVGVGLVVLVLLMAWSVVVSVVQFLTCDFAIPIMYIRNVGVIAAFVQAWDLLKAQGWDAVIYVLLRIAAVMVMGFAGFFAACLGGLIGAVPMAGLLGGSVATLLAGTSPQAFIPALLVLLPAWLALVLAIQYAAQTPLLPFSWFIRVFSLKYLGAIASDLAIV